MSIKLIKAIRAAANEREALDLLEAAQSPSRPLVEVQEPVGEVQRVHYGGRARNIGTQKAVLYPGSNVMDGTKLYAAPVRGLPLTDSQIDEKLSGTGIIDCLIDHYDKHKTGDPYGSIPDDMRRSLFDRKDANRSTSYLRDARDTNLFSDVIRPGETVRQWL